MATATLTHGRDGGRPIAWIAGEAAGFSQQYEFPAGKPLQIADVDATALRAGKIDTGGRTFEVTGEVKTAPSAEIDKTPPVASMSSDLGDGPGKGKA